MEPFARMPIASEDYEDRKQRDAIDAAVGKRRRATRWANLGSFTGYRIGLDVGNGNIGWCVLFEQGKRLRFMRADDIEAHNRALPPSAARTQLPDLDRFVPLGTHKFDAREQKAQKSYSKVRAEARAARRMLDARQRRRLHVGKALREAGLLPQHGEPPDGRTDIKADALRVRLLDPSFQAHPHDLGRALANALKRRGYLKPIGRSGADRDSGFAKGVEERYREALKRFDCRTVGEFLERCASDARRDGERFRKRHRSLDKQKEDRNKRPKGDNAPSYEVFQFLTPTFSLIREECGLLKEKSGVEVDPDKWAAIEEAAEFRRPLWAKLPGRCRYLPNEHRCVVALPSFQRFRILKSIDNLRDGRGRPLTAETRARAREILECEEKVTLAELKWRLGGQTLKLDRGDSAGSRTLAGARTDIALTEAFGEAWSGLPSRRRDDWTMRFLRRHWPGESNEAGEFRPWTERDDEDLKRDAETAFGPDALAKVDDRAKAFEDKFASLSVKAARLLADCYERGLGYDERREALREAGAPEPELAPCEPPDERLPYYGEAMPDQTVPAESFAPADRTSEEEMAHGRSANPDVHVVMNRLRAVVNAIVDMMGGIPPTTCAIEMARSTFSETQADAHRSAAQVREKLRDRIVEDIEGIMGQRTPTGPRLDRLVDRWKAAIRQGWRDYDGSEIQKSVLIDGAEYQLDHVEPAAFGAFRENNMFVSRFNRKKGRRLPWEAFGDDPKFRPALVAFATFGLKSRIEMVEKRLNGRTPLSDKQRGRLEEALDRARRELTRLADFGPPQPDVLAALEKPPPAPRAFKPGDRDALFRRLHPDRAPREGGPAARDIANIGWSTKLARRYLQRIGAETEPIAAWAVHALRCMFGVNKDRTDLRNHAVDAFLVAHFDKRVLKPAFDRLRHELGHEALYGRRVLRDALARIDGGAAMFGDFEGNLDRLEEVLPHIHTAHRPDNRWNPGDAPGGSFGALGGQNVYAFRPDWKTRKTLTGLLREAGAIPDGESILDKKEILACYEAIPKDTRWGRWLSDKLVRRIETRYLHREASTPKATRAKLKTVLPLSRQKGAFIDAEGKFAVVGSPELKNRKVVSTAEFSRMTLEERENVFTAGVPVFRSGDTVCKDGKAFVVTGLNADTRLIAYPVDKAERKKDDKHYITISEDVSKVSHDVLGRPPRRRGKTSGSLEPAPYPLRDR